MSTKKSSAWIAGFLLISISALAQDQGGSTDVGGGGGIVRRSDGAVVSADSYHLRAGACLSCRQLGEDLVNELLLVKRLLKIRTGSGEFIEQHVLDPLVEYRFVHQLPPGCDTHDEPNYKVLAGDKYVQSFCTQGRITYVQESWFAQLSLIHKTTMLTHERIHGAVPNAPHEHLVDFTRAIELLLELTHKQQLGERPLLSAEQIAILELLPLRNAQLGLIDAGAYKKFSGLKIAPWGGGLVGQASLLGANAYLDHFSLLAGKAVLEDGSSVFDTVGYDATLSVHLGAGAAISSSTLKGRIDLDAKASVASSRLSGDIRLLPSARVEASTLETAPAAPTRLGGTLIRTVALNCRLETAPSTVIADSTLNFGRLILSDGAHLNKVTLNKEYSQYLRYEPRITSLSLGAAVTLENVRLDGNWEIEPGVEISDSTLSAEQGHIYSNAVIQRSRIHAPLPYVAKDEATDASQQSRIVLRGTARVLDSELEIREDTAAKNTPSAEIAGLIRGSLLAARSLVMPEDSEIVDSVLGTGDRAAVGGDPDGFDKIDLSKGSRVERFSMRGNYLYGRVDLKLGERTQLLNNMPESWKPARVDGEKDFESWFLVHTLGNIAAFYPRRATVQFADARIFDFEHRRICPNTTGHQAVNVFRGWMFPRTKVFSKNSRVLKRAECEWGK